MYILNIFIYIYYVDLYPLLLPYPNNYYVYMYDNYYADEIKTQQ